MCPNLTQVSRGQSKNTQRKVERPAGPHQPPDKPRRLRAHGCLGPGQSQGPQAVLASDLLLEWQELASNCTNRPEQRQDPQRTLLLAGLS